jgi:hypothetical protein
MKTSIKIISIIIILLVVSVTFKFINDAELAKENINKLNEEPVIEPVYKNASANLIQVELPYPGAVTGKEFKIIGKARGYWFFEGSFPVELQTLDGNILGGGVATAEGEWMTEDFVNFTAEMQTPSAFIGPAILILRKDNPSGLPENDASISFPITVEY